MSQHLTAFVTFGTENDYFAFLNIMFWFIKTKCNVFLESVSTICQKAITIGTLGDFGYKSTRMKEQ